MQSDSGLPYVAMLANSEVVQVENALGKRYPGAREKRTQGRHLEVGRDVSKEEHDDTYGCCLPSTRCLVRASTISGHHLHSHPCATTTQCMWMATKTCMHAGKRYIKSGMCWTIIIWWRSIMIARKVERRYDGVSKISCSYTFLMLCDVCVLVRALQNR